MCSQVLLLNNPITIVDRLFSFHFSSTYMNNIFNNAKPKRLENQILFCNEKDIVIEGRYVVYIS